MRGVAARRQSVAREGLEIAVFESSPASKIRRGYIAAHPMRPRARSGGGGLRLLGLARLGADRLGANRLFSRGGRPDAHRLAGGRGRSLTRLGTSPELRPARRRQLGLLGDHAGGDTVDIGNFGAAKPKGVAGAGLLLLGGISVAQRRPHRNRKPHCQRQTELDISGPQHRDYSPDALILGIVGERRRIGKQG